LAAVVRAAPAPAAGATAARTGRRMKVSRSAAVDGAALMLPVGVTVAAVGVQAAYRPLQAVVAVLVGLAFAAAASSASPTPSVADAVPPRAPTREGRDRRMRPRGRVAGALVVLAVGAAYFGTLSPTTNATDSIEFQLVAATLRIAHAPGYALYTMLGHLFTQLPVADVAWRMNVLSAACGTVAAALAFALARRLANDPLAGVVAALALAFTPQLWSQAVITEVYTLNVVLVLGVLACLAHLRRDGQRLPRQATRGRHARPGVSAVPDGGGRADAAWRLAALTLAGLGFTHHLTTVFLYPVVAWLVLARDPRLLTRPGDVARSALAFIVGLAPLLYFPWRWQGVNGTVLDVPTLFGYVTGRNYPGLFDLSRLPDEPARWELLRHAIDTAFGPLMLVFAAVGLAALAARRRFDWAVALAAIAGAYAVFYLGYFAWDGWVVLLPALAAVAIAAGIGAASAANAHGPTSRRSTFRRSAVAAVCAGAVTVSLARTWPRVDASRGWPGQAAADAALAEPIPQGARLVVHPSVGAGFLYARHLKGVRPDLDVVYADWPAGRRALADPRAEDRPVVAYGFAREALSSTGIRLVPIGPSYALVPSSDVGEPSGIAAPRQALATADDALQVVGWRTVSAPARAGTARILPGDDVIVQLVLQGSGVPDGGGHVRVRLVADATGRTVAAGQTTLLPERDARIATGEIRLGLAREVTPGAYVLEGALDRRAAEGAAWREIGTLTIASITRRDLAVDPSFGDVVPVRRAWPDGTMLVGIEAPATVGVGASLDVRAYWAHPSAVPAGGGTVRLTDARSGDDPSDAADLPSGSWPGGTDAVLVTRHSLVVAVDDACAGFATLRGVRCALGSPSFAPRLVRRVDRTTAGTPFGRAWRLPRVALRRETPGLDGPLEFEGGVSLVGFLPRRRLIRPGDWLAVETKWTADRAPSHRDKAFVQLLDAEQALRAGSDREILYGAEPMDAWRSGEVHADTFYLRVPPDMPTGPAILQLGLYDRDSRARRAVVGADGSKGDDRVLTGLYTVAGTRTPGFPAAFTTADIAFDGGPRLTGIDAPTADGLRPGDAVTVTLRWHVEEPIARDWTVFLHVLRDPSATEPAAQADGSPLGPHFPTHLWPRGATLESTHVLTWPDDLPDGSVTSHWMLALGLYDVTTLERALVRGQAAGGDVDAEGRRVRLPLGKDVDDAESATTSP